MAREYDNNGRNRYGRRKIGGTPRTESPANAYAGVNANYALQNRNIPSFGNPGGALNAQQWGSMARERGMRINRDGSTSPTRGPGGPPLDPGSFRQALQQRGRMGGRRAFRDEAPVSDSMSGAMGGSVLGSPSQSFRPRLQATAPEQNRARLQEMVAGRRLMDSVRNPSPVFRSSPEAVAAGQPGTVLRSKYGTGSVTTGGTGAPSTIGGRPSSEFFQNAADRQGVANKFAKPGGEMDPKKWREALAKKNLDKPGTRRI